MTTETRVLALIELSWSIVVVAMVLLILRIQGFDRSLAWAFLMLQAILHIIGSTAQLYVDDYAESYLINENLDILSFIPALISLLCLSEQMNDLMNYVAASCQTFRLLLVTVTVAAFLIVFGGVTSARDAASTTPIQDITVLKLGLFLMAVVLLTAMYISVSLFLQVKQLNGRADRLIVCCIAQSTPFLTIRLASAITYRYRPSFLAMSVSGYVTSRGLAIILVELIAVNLHLFVGYLDRAGQGQSLLRNNSYKIMDGDRFGLKKSNCFNL